MKTSSLRDYCIICCLLTTNKKWKLKSSYLNISIIMLLEAQGEKQQGDKNVSGERDLGAQQMR